MGHIGHQLHFHALALHLLCHCFLKSLLNPINLGLKGFKYSQVFRDLHLQITIRNFVGGPQQNTVFFLQVADIFFYHKIQQQRVYNHPEPARHPHGTEQQYHDPVDSQQPDHLPAGISGDIQIYQGLIITANPFFAPAPDPGAHHALMQISPDAQPADLSQTAACIPGGKKQSRYRRQIQPIGQYVSPGPPIYSAEIIAGIIGNIQTGGPLQYQGSRHHGQRYGSSNHRLCRSAPKMP